MTASFVRWHSPDGWRPALAFEGRKKFRLVVVEATGLRIVLAPRTEARYMRELGTLAKGLDGFRRLARNKGATVGAVKLLATV